MRASICNTRPRRGQPACYVAVIADATEVWHKEEKITHLAYHDPLTDLPNRTLLLDLMAHAIKVAALDNYRMGVLFIHLDGFKAVNDTLGHHVGDQVLKDVAASLTACVRNSDTVSRIGGDEFVALMESMDKAQKCSVLAEKPLLKLSREATAGGSKIRIGSSVGIAIYPDDGTDAAILLQSADTALYDAKAAGKGTFRYAARSA